MTQEQWIEHIETVSGLTRPEGENGCQPADWHSAYDLHKYTDPGCTICKERRATKRAVKAAKNKRMMYSDLGLIRVKGALGGIYYE